MMFFLWTYRKISLKDFWKGYERMKKIIMVVLSALVVLSLAACQATPEQSIVQEKNLDRMIEEAKQPSAQDSAGQSASGGAIADKIGAQGNYTKELVDAKGKVKIHVNADVQVPNTKGVTVQRVEPAQFTQDQVSVLLKQMVKGDLFSGDDYKPSKSDLEKQILALQAALGTNGDGSSTSPAPSDPMMQKFGGIAQQMVTDLQKQLETAPETSTKTPIDGKLTPFDDGEKGQKVYGLAQSENGYESFDLVNWDNNYGSMVDYTREKNGFSKAMGYFSTKDAIAQTESYGGHPSIASADIAKIPDVTMTKDQAKQKADALIAELGLKDMKCISQDKEYGGSYETTTGMGMKLQGTQPTFINPRQCVWYLRYARDVNNIPVTYTVYDCIKVENDQQSQPWPYEDMAFAIDDSGIVGFEWRSPYKLTDLVTQNSKLLTFDKAMNVFDTMSLVVNAWEGYTEGNPNLTGIDITVDHIVLGLTRITEQNKRNSGLLVPAWDFIGTVNYINQVDGKTKTMPDGPVPVLTVNAIDGSVINRNLGY